MTNPSEPPRAAIKAESAARPPDAPSGERAVLSRAVAALGEVVLVVDADQVVRAGAGRDGVVGLRVTEALGAGLGLLVEGVVERCRDRGDVVLDLLPSSLVPSGRMEVRATPGLDGVVVALRDAGDAPRLRRDLAGANEAIERLSAALEDRVARRTRALSQLISQLEESVSGLERERGEVVEDLRAPLGAVARAVTSVLAADSLDDADRSELARAMRSLDGMRRRLDDLAAMPMHAHPTAGPVDLAHVVDLVRRRFHDAGEVVPIASIGRPPVVMADAVAVELALSAAVFLALEAGCPHVELRAIETGFDVVGRLPDRLGEITLRPADVQAVEARQREAGGAAHVRALASEVTINLRYEVLADAGERVHTNRA